MLAAYKLAIWVRLTFAVFKFGECHVWRSIFVCKYIIFGQFYFGEPKEPHETRIRVLAKIKHSTYIAVEWISSIRPGFLAGNSVFWRETPSVNIVSIASYKMNYNAAIRKQMWLIFLIL